MTYPYFRFTTSVNICKKVYDFDKTAQTSLVKQIIDMLNDRKSRLRDYVVPRRNIDCSYIGCFYFYVRGLWIITNLGSIFRWLVNIQHLEETYANI